jgi:hypothetical protein
LSSPVYSQRFIVDAGVTGTGRSITVPAGHVYLVRFVSIYCNAPGGVSTVFFEDEPTGAALLFASSADSNPIHMAQDCRFVFEAGQGFHFQVNNEVGFTNAADVCASGYDLLEP